MLAKNQLDLEKMTDIVTEQELLDLFGCKKSTLAMFRKQGLPFCRLSQTNRVYIVKDVLEFIKDKRMVASDDE